MRRVTSFSSLEDALNHRMNRLLSLAVEAQHVELPEKRRLASYLAIEMHSTWTAVARSCCVSSLCGVETVTGNWASPANGVMRDATHAVNVASALFARPNARHSEPHWFDKTIVTRLSSNFALSNAGSIAAALSVQTTVFEQLPTFRNYFAHKCEETASKVENLRRRRLNWTAGCPSQILLDAHIGARSPVMIEWIYDIKRMGAALLN